MKQSLKFLFAPFIPWTDLGNGIRRQVMGFNDNIMMVKVDFKADAIGTLHHHPHSQSTYVVSGLFELTIDNETRILKPGDGFFAASNIEHGVVCIEEGILVDAFSPVREDFLK
jgi:quercetin dioxygenase-like cupin family protein